MNSDWPYDFPGANWLDEAEEEAVLNVLRKGSVFRYYGPGEPTHVAKLEATAKQFYGVKNALAVSSGTGSLFTSMQALGVGPGCEVIVPSFMWVATMSAVVNANAIPVLCEVDDSFCMDPADLEKKITKRTGLIVPVHMAGCPCDMARIMAIADRHGIAVLEDCAQCNGGSFAGRKVGTFGSMGMFSFQINKNATAGEGGVIVTDDDELYLRAVALHDLGVPWKDAQPDADCGIHLWGQGRRMSELCGSVANVQLGKLPDIVEHMRGSKSRIKEALAGMAGLGFRRLNDPDGDTGPFLILMLDDEARAAAVAAKIQAAGIKGAVQLSAYGLHIYYNIDALVQKVPLSAAGNPWSLAENAQSNYKYARGACPVSDDLFGRSVLVPVPSRLTEVHEQTMIDIIRKAMG